jgi:hypothetical protein
MPMLTDDEIKTMAQKALSGVMVDNWDIVNDALETLWAPNGDAGDGYLLITLLIQVILDAMPKARCPKHGTACLKINFHSSTSTDRVPDDYGDVADQVYMTMVRAEFAEDDDASVAAYCTAVQAGVGHVVLYQALRNAGYVMSRKLASLQ